ncbi:MAG: hypothetical protein ABIA97_06720 [Candidatus Omnitrophota bacterium]
MGKKRSIGVTVVGWLFVSLGVIPLCVFVVYNSLRINQGTTMLKDLFIPFFLLLFFCLFFIAFGYDVLRLKERSRKALIVLSSICSFSFGCALLLFFLSGRHIVPEQNPSATLPFALALATMLVLNIFIIYFLTRPKVKRQFTGAESPQQSGGDKRSEAES